MTEETALAPSDDVAALEGLRVNEVGAVLGVVWQSFGRRTVVDAWHIGRALRRVKDGMPGRQFAPYCEQIQMTRSWAYKLLQLADGPLAEMSSHRTVDGAVKALRAAPAEAEPEAIEEQVVEEEHPPPPVVEEQEEEHPPPREEQVVEEVAAEAAPAAAAEQREEMLERWAIRTEHENGNEIERLNLLLDRADARDRDRLATINAERRRRQAAERRDRETIDALLAIPRGEGDAGIDGVLAGRGLARRKVA